MPTKQPKPELVFAWNVYKKSKKQLHKNENINIQWTRFPNLLA